MIRRLLDGRTRRRGGLGWTCHFCGAWRPDEKVGVVAVEEDAGLFRVRHSRRFCRDRRECRVAAHGWMDEFEKPLTVRFS